MTAIRPTRHETRLRDLAGVEHDVQHAAASGNGQHARNARARDGEPVKLPSPREPVAVARRFVEARQHDDVLTLRRWRGGWWAWTGPKWAEVENTKIRADLYDFTEHATYLDASKKEPVVKPWEPNRYKIADLSEALAAICHLAGNVETPTWTENVELPRAREFVSVANGLLHISTREVIPHNPRLFNEVAVPFDYDASAPAPTRWLEFLEQLWPDDADSVAALQEFFGYVISGRTDLHKILLLIGPTRAGKGVIARTLKDLVGHGNYAGPTLASLGTNFGLQPLIGKPLAIISDARLGGANVHQVVERLLSVSGEDMLTIDVKYAEPWTGTLPTRFVVISNELPRFGDASGAIAGRFVLLTLANSWLGREDPHLSATLRTELPGILGWALDGLTRLSGCDRFTEPKASRDAIVTLQDLVSPVAAFVRDRCERAGDEQCDVLYQAWKSWAEDNGHRVGSAQTFGRDLRAVVPGVKVVRPRATDGTDRPRRYKGVTVSRRADNARSSGPRGPEGSDDGRGPHGPEDQPLSLSEDSEPF